MKLRLISATSLLLVSLAAGCGGGSGGGSASTSSNPIPVASATPVAVATPANVVATVPLAPASGSISVPFPTLNGVYTGQLTAAGVGLSSPTNVQVGISLGAPPMLSGAVNAPKPIVAYTGTNGSTPTVLDYVQLVPTADLSITGTVSMTLGYPVGTLDPQKPYYYALWFGQLSGLDWIDNNPVAAVDFMHSTITLSGTPATAPTPFTTFRGGFIYGFAIYHN